MIPLHPEQTNFVKSFKCRNGEKGNVLQVPDIFEQWRYQPGNVTNALQMSFMSTVTHVSDELQSECRTSASGTVMGQIQACKMTAAKRRVNIISDHNPYDGAYLCE